MHLKIVELKLEIVSHHLNKTDAHFWIAKSKDFDQICWWAGWEPDDVRYRYYKALKKR